MSRFVIPLTLAIVLALVACASPSALRCPSSARADRERVTSEELIATGASDLFTALRLSRPRFLETRAPRKDAPVLYVDGVQVGEVAYLRGMRVQDVASVRLLRGPDATTRYGTDHLGGALLVTTIDGSTARCW
ncbi:MAG: hypothetical protein PVI57_12950 [Gemmatimonadota bacterium]|jgi:hypothetical protein